MIGAAGKQHLEDPTTPGGMQRMTGVIVHGDPAG
jgi:hypothetical protein